MELRIVRHAESEPNVAGVISSDPSRPSPLTRRGRLQAEALAERLAGEQIDLCVTSELERSIATADLALAGRAIERQVMPELNDPRAGDFEGGSADDHQHWLQAHGLPAPNPGGESQLDALRRYARAYRKIAGLSQGRILAVAHGMPIAWLRSAHRSAAAGGSGRPHADFADPGVAFAGTPDRMNSEELVAAAAILERLAAQSG